MDVGRDQLHPRLRADPRVVVLEATDARDLDAKLVPEPPELIACDVSFIGVAKALPCALTLAAPGSDLVTLVKPQFEVGPERVGKGGLVKSAEDRAAALDAVVAFLAGQGWRMRQTCESPILGGAGARELLLWASRG